MWHVLKQISRYINSQLGRPHLTSAEFRFLKSHIKKSDCVLEFGSGASTKYISKMCKELHSIEHDPVWFGRTMKDTADLKNATVHLETDMKKYARESTITLPFFDVAYIDGRHRVQCADAIRNTIEWGAKVFVHDWHRKKYHKILKWYNFVDRVDDLVLLEEKDG